MSAATALHSDSLAGSSSFSVCSLFRMVGRHEANIREVAVTFRIIHSISDNEQVGNGEANVVRINPLNSSRRLVEQSRNPQGFGVMLKENLAQIGECETSVENILDQQDVLSFDWLVQILDQFHGAGGALPFSVTGYRDKIESRINPDGSRQVRKKNGGTFQNSNHHCLFAIQIARNLGSHFRHPLGYLLMGVEDLKPLVCDG